MWEALKDLVRSKAEYYRNKAKATDNPKAPPEGPAARWTAGGTWAAVFAAMLAACIFWRQWDTMRKQLDADERHFALEERPILAQDDTQMPASLPHLQYDSVKGQIIWSYGVKNYGKSTAFEIRAYEYISIAGGPFTGIQDSTYPRWNNDTVPTQGFYSSDFNRQPIKPETYNSAVVTTGGIRMYVVIRYKDSSGQSYEGFICLSKNANESVGNCTRSDIGNVKTINPPPPAPPKTIF